MTKKEMFKQFLTTLKYFVDIDIPEDWPDNCVLTFEDDAINWKTKKPFIFISYLSEINENDLHIPTIKEWRELQTLYEKIKKEDRRERIKKSKT